MTHRLFEVPVPGERFRWGDDGNRPDGLALFLMGIQWESILGPLGAKVKIDIAKGVLGHGKIMKNQSILHGLDFSVFIFRRECMIQHILSFSM